MTATKEDNEDLYHITGRRLSGHYEIAIHRPMNGRVVDYN